MNASDSRKEPGIGTTGKQLRRVRRTQWRFERGTGRGF